jgi:hypothetical protein
MSAKSQPWMIHKFLDVKDMGDLLRVLLMGFVVEGGYFVFIKENLTQMTIMIVSILINPDSKL